jgi:PAS domain S-box-containing protein
MKHVIFMTDLQGTITYISPSSAAVFGWPADEMLNQHFPVFLTEGGIPLALARFEHLLSTAQTTRSLSLNMKRRDGTEFVGEIRAALIYQNGAMCGTIGVIRDITERQRAEEQLRAALQEKEVLLKEIHHRVKNNMQVISSLLHLQAPLLQDEHDRALFKESQQRVKTMALLHEKLYRSDSLHHIDAREYITALVHDVYQSYASSSSAIALHIDTVDMDWNVDIAIPCGLIINELVTNAMKYAFPDGTGTITVTLTTAPDGQRILQVSDNGIGLPQAFNLDRLDSLGLELVKGLTEEQLRGNLVVERDAGTTFRILFPDNT